MTESRPEFELLSAYLDGQLDDQERAQAERLLSDDPEARAFLADLKRLRASMAELPRHRLGDDFAADVLRRAEQEVLTRGDRSPDLTTKMPRPHENPADPVVSPATGLLRRLISSRAIGWSIAIILIAILLNVNESEHSSEAPLEPDSIAMKMADESAARRPPVISAFTAPPDQEDTDQAKTIEKRHAESESKETAPVLARSSTHDRDNEIAGTRVAETERSATEIKEEHSLLKTQSSTLEKSIPDAADKPSAPQERATLKEETRFAQKKPAARPAEKRQAIPTIDPASKPAASTLVIRLEVPDDFDYRKDLIPLVEKLRLSNQTQDAESSETKSLELTGLDWAKLIGLLKTLNARGDRFLSLEIRSPSDSEGEPRLPETLTQFNRTRTEKTDLIQADMAGKKSDEPERALTLEAPTLKAPTTSAPTLGQEREQIPSVVLQWFTPERKPTTKASKR